MSTAEASLCSHLLKLYFGDPIQDIGTYLMKQPCQRSLFDICSNVSLPRSLIQVGLRVLLMHNIAEVSKNSSGIDEYEVKCENVLPLAYQPSYANYAKVMFGDIAEIIIVKIIEHGKLTFAEILKQTVKGLQNIKNNGFGIRKITEIRNIFQKLIKRKLIYKIVPAQFGTETSVYDLSTPTCILLELHDVNLAELISSTNTNGKSLPKKMKIFNDKDIYWGINRRGFHICLRDQALIAATESSINKVASNIVKVVLEISQNMNDIAPVTTSPVSFYQILKAVKQFSSSMNEKDLEKYLSILINPEENFMAKSDDQSGGMYVVNIHKILEKLAEENAACVIENRLGSKYSRIFRIILKNKYLEQKQIESLAMIPLKDAKDHAYQLYQENFLVTQEISKTPDFASGRMFFLFHADIEQISKMLLIRNIQATLNVLITYESQKKNQRRILEKKKRIETIVSTLAQSGGDKEQIKEVRQMITPQEVVALEKVENTCMMLFKSVNELSETIILLNMYLASVVATKIPEK